jgi:hypothetical protein
MKKQMRLDEVGAFGEKIRFLIPHEWVEVDDGPDNYLYQAPHADSGWLRVSLITVTTDEPEERLLQLFADSGDLYISEKRGNYVQRSEKRSHENGNDIYLYYWKVANVVPPDRVLEAVFSYTILAERREDTETQDTVELVGTLVAETIFSSGLENSMFLQ